MTSSLDLLNVHADLTELFLRHQEALVGLDLPVARERLEAFASAIQAHIAVEEERLLPLYEARCIPPPGSGIELFLVEHRRIEGYIAEFRATLVGLLEVGSPVRRRVVALLDRQWHLKGLLEHHDLRERNALYPQLDKVTPPEERARILEGGRA